MIVHIFVLNMVRNPNRWLPHTSTWLGEKFHAAGSLHRRSLLGPAKPDDSDASTDVLQILQSMGRAKRQPGADGAK